MTRRQHPKDCCCPNGRGYNDYDYYDDDEENPERKWDKFIIKHNYVSVGTIYTKCDYTLWSANVTCHEANPFKKDSDGLVYSSDGKPVSYYAEVPDILELLLKEGYQMAVASRTEWPEEERLLLELFELDDYFAYKEIRVGNKTEHIKSIRAKSGVRYEDMLLFDDSQVNIRTVSDLGVQCYQVKNGMSFDVLKQGLEKFAGIFPLPNTKVTTQTPAIQVQHILKSYKLYKTYSKLK